MPEAPEAEVDNEIALFIHANHDALIRDLKDRQWQVFRWTVTWYASIFIIASEKPNILAGLFCLPIIGLIIAFIIFCLVIVHTQDGLKQRRRELKHLKKKMGSSYNKLRLEKHSSHATICRDWQVWGSMIILNAMALTLSIFSVMRAF